MIFLRGERFDIAERWQGRTGGGIFVLRFDQNAMIRVRR
jgi:hypothetical protein